MMKKYLKLLNVVSVNGHKGSQGDEGGDVGSNTVLERSKPALKKPPMYKVIMFNDDYTPMEFVVEVLELYFSMNRETATPRYVDCTYPGQGRLWRLYS